MDAILAFLEIKQEIDELTFVMEKDEESLLFLQKHYPLSYRIFETQWFIFDTFDKKILFSFCPEKGEEFKNTEEYHKTPRNRQHQECVKHSCDVIGSFSIVRSYLEYKLFLVEELKDQAISPVWYVVKIAKEREGFEFKENQTMEEHNEEYNTANEGN
jgi:hypothetical protein